jgi:hypothetical protein
MTETSRVTLDAQSLATRGAIAGVISLVVNVVIVLGAQSMDVAPGFDPLTVPQTSFFTIVGVVGAVVVYRLVQRRAEAPDRTFIRIASVVLVVSFLPDIGLLSADETATFPAVLLLMVMHVVVAVIAIGLLVYWDRE